MRLLNFILDNWWMLLFAYGILRFFTKAKTAASVTAARKAEFAQRVRDAGADAAPAADATAEWSSDERDFDDAENKRIYKFESPVSDEEVKDAAERLRAYAFVDADTLPSPKAAAIDAPRVMSAPADAERRAYAVPAVAGPAALPLDLAFTSDDMRRAFIYAEILSAPRSTRPLR